MTTRTDVLIKGREQETRTKNPFKNVQNSTCKKLHRLQLWWLASDISASNVIFRVSRSSSDVPSYAGVVAIAYLLPAAGHR